MRPRPPRRLLSMLTAGGTVGVVLAAGLVALAAPAEAADCSAVSCTSTYRGGGLQVSPHTHLVRWGVNTDPVQWDAAQRLLTDIDGSGYLAPLAQYSVSSPSVQKLTRTATFDGTVRIFPANGSATLGDADIQAELRQDIDVEDLPPASWRDDYIVMMPPGVTVTMPNGAATTCGYHNQTFDSDGSTPIRYAVIPDLGTAASRSQCFGGSAPSPYTSMVTGAVSDQLVQLITDPSSGWSAPTGWYADAAGELGDTCSTAPRGSVGGQFVHPYWSNRDKTCVLGQSAITWPDPPESWTTSSTVTATFTATDVYGARPTFTCSLDGATAKACTADSVLSYSGLRTGTHTIKVTGTDAGHGLGSSTARFIVDQTTPTASISALPAFTGASSVTVKWAGTDTGTGVSSYDLRVRSAAFTGGFGGFTVPDGAAATSARSFTYSGLLPGYDYCFSVRATDGAGHVSRWSGETCVSRLLDDRAARTGSGWRAATGGGYYAGTFLQTTRKGATIAVAGFTGDRVAILATTCAKCGSVKVYVGSKLVKTVDLTSKKTLRSTLIPLPTFGRTSGTVKVVTTSTKAVTIDGFGLSRT